jgi:hypothetical protein
MAAVTCRECPALVSRVPCIKFGSGTIKGGAYLCVECATRWTKNNPVTDIGDFVVKYVRAHMDPNELIRMERDDLRRQVVALKAQLEQAKPQYK